MAARKTFYSTEDVLKYLNGDDFESEIGTSFSDDSDENEDTIAGDNNVTSERNQTGDDNETNGSPSQDDSANEVGPSHEESPINRSDFLYASSEEEQVSSSESSDANIEDRAIDLSENKDTQPNSVEMNSSNSGTDSEISMEDECDGSEDNTSLSESPTPVVELQEHGRGRGRQRGRGRGRGRTSGRSRTLPYLNAIPPNACPITTPDTDHTTNAEFCPLRTPGPQLPDDCEACTELDYFRLFFDDVVLDMLVKATKAYAEDKKDAKPTMYRRFMLKELTSNEMLGFVGVLLHLGINSVRNYKQVWNIKSSQVSHNCA